MIAGANNGVGFRGGAGTVINAGSITSVTNNGVYLNRGGTVTNQAGGIIAGAPMASTIATLRSPSSIAA